MGLELLLRKKKMKILLINLKSPALAGQKITYMPPVHLWKIRSTLIRLKHFELVDICDEHIGEKCQDYLKKTKYDWVGISCRFSIQHHEYKRVAKLAKKAGSYVIAGGAHAGITEHIKNVDIITRLPGEYYFKPTFDDSVDNFVYPEFSYEEIQRYLDRKRPHDLKSKTDKWINVTTSYGCNRDCGFCAIKKLSVYNGWRSHSVKYLEEHFEYLFNKGINEIFFEDDNISLDKNRFIKIIDILNSYGFWWSCPNGIYIRSLLDEKVIKNLAGSKCWRLSLPFETGSERSAGLMNLGNKWLNFISAEYIVNRLNKIGIKTCGFFIIGYPGETEKDIKMTLEYANKLNLNQRNIYIATPYPGTRLFHECIVNGYINFDDNFYEKLLYKNAVINTPWLSAQRVMEIKAEDRRKALERIQNNYEETIYGNQKKFE